MDCDCDGFCQLDDQFIPATRELLVFTKAKDRYFDLDAVREAPTRSALDRAKYGYTPEIHDPRDSRSAKDRATQLNPIGVPPLDWWKITDSNVTPDYTGEPMTATFYVGDCIKVMGKLPEKSVDLILTSPPFLALRSYLPADHPDKALEGGSQSTPGEFIDWLLDVVDACARVLAPHGSLVFELGDTFSGSGGAGGDYSDNGWRDGQPKFGGSATASRESAWSLPQATWFAGVIDTEGYIGIRRQESQRDSPSFSAAVRITMMDRQVCDRAAEIAGVGNITEDKRGAYSWSVVGQQARYVLTNIWPYLLIKQRQAMAAIEMQRNIEEKKRRGPYERIQQEDIEYRQMIREYVAGLNGRGEKRGVYVPTWAPPTPPRLHPPTTGHLDGWPQAKSLSLIPESFRWAMVYGRNPFTGRECATWRLRNVIRWVRPNPPVGALGDKFRPATSELMVFCKAKDRFFDLDAVREAHKYGDYAPGMGDKIRDPSRGNGGDLNKPADHVMKPNPAGAPPLDWWNIPPGGYPGAHYAVWPPELLIKPIKAMTPSRVCRVCGEPSRRIVETEQRTANGQERVAQFSPSRGTDTGREDGHRRGGASDAGTGQPSFVRHATTVGWTDCGHDDWRPGLVLDCFGGSGTTAVVATGHGRDCILVDLDSRNYDLALERVGPFILTLAETDTPPT